MGIFCKYNVLLGNLPFTYNQLKKKILCVNEEFPSLFEVTGRAILPPGKTNSLRLDTCLGIFWMQYWDTLKPLYIIKCSIVLTMLLLRKSWGGCLSVMMLSYQCRHSHYKDKMVSLLSHLYMRNPYSWKDGLYIETGPCCLHCCPYNYRMLCHVGGQTLLRDTESISFWICDHGNLIWFEWSLVW